MMDRSGVRRHAFILGLAPAVLGWFALAFAVVSATGADSVPAGVPSAPSASSAVQPLGPKAKSFLETHCVSCHSGDKPKGDLRLELTAQDFADPAIEKHWAEALDKVDTGEMPPAKKPRPSADEIRNFAQWVRGGIQAAAVRRRAEQGRGVIRRLNRAEYQNTIRDLLGIEIDLNEGLPLDSSAEGFDNVGSALQTSSFLLERYLEAADLALDVAIANRKQPPMVKKRVDPREERHVKVTTEKVFRKLDEGLAMFSSSAWQAITVSQFYPPDRGTYRFRISARAVQSGGKPVTFRVDAGPMQMGTQNHFVGYFDATDGKSTIVEFTDHLEARSTIRILPYGLASAQAVNKVGADTWDGPGVAMEWIEVEGPLNEIWPPASHRRIFGDLPQIAAPIFNQRDRMEVTSPKPMEDATAILRSFARRAFRRAVTDDDLKLPLSLVQKKLDARESFEQAMRVGLKAVLTSPHFLFIAERPGKLSDFALASRLSYFLWSSMPDDELLGLAEKGSLGEPATLRKQIERMLADRKAKAFTENFVGQWLQLREIDFTAPDPRLYPEFDDMLKVSMVRETHLFFDELLKNDLNVANFLSSDFTMLNGRLAKHYGIPGVDGFEMRKVALPPGTHRGGVLTMASVLKVSANGTNTSPVVRGAWVLDRILGTPPSPPPTAVSAIEPDIRGATTIREQLAKHREIESCAGCHRKIDPPGFALESFDVIGGWRTNYRSIGRGTPVTIDGRRVPYSNGPKVDPADALPDGRAFEDIDGLKKHLLADRDRFAKVLTRKLMTYATGYAVEPADEPGVEAIVAKVRDRGYGLRSLVHEIVQSELFRTR